MSATPPPAIRLCVTGGGTGGHTYPALTTIDAVRRHARARGRDVDVLWVGTATGLEARVAPEHGIPFTAITTGKLRRSPNLRELGTNVADAFRVPLGVLQAISAVRRHRPDVVLSTGGYVAVPIGLAAFLLRRPLVMHEQTTTLGLANRILARFATRIAVSHDSSLEHLSGAVRRKAVVTGNPVRPEVLRGDPARGRAMLGLAPGQPLVYVTGGAQGSKQINTLIEALLPHLLTRAYVLHQCGPAWADQLAQAAAALPGHLRARYRPVPYLGAELPDILAAADVVVSRSGAGTLAELTAIGKPSVLIPLIPSGGDEQRGNARHLAAAGAARALLEPGPTPEDLMRELALVLDDPGRRAHMAAAARALGRTNAADNLTALIMDTLR
ncbi:UDP-N-acetylglucosamine--N-acetylmuramyl-(pentapeptide) pyrophosphoryl-undecaprenol N-acetylglucosamine transferase [Thermocatellispora tengchongensis]|uniref:UDP-N-acetylglucosamine--N-acetylmuramyl-(pentapeptide) pyrophosphoryl-undecaprenol N-acetylglucosamine transferase n=1 Tax=Thermocatellispora tengchongensis TaxID=1073253 RepID=A0A840P9T7_9ACTN|nr:UDP-N-acetylglucosamine--N-acetylmuramyl-(pentapeptide) pyrophosphoryl-undecaprenol N-acetylglucosamine transferase [Thermocatellispora tengchongensis]MBB5134683.1 UDP-N-acetylglucosamine--N-acetylmuramyl-(pentapeptide) pyrophosphoryl-undecaprenol N-acetylglucosamine transferase [Thermocatellispora tengchongensis]